MIFRIQMKDPRRMIAIGTIFLAVGILLPMFYHPATQFGRNWIDGARGLLVGISLGINIGAILLARRQSRCAAK